MLGGCCGCLLGCTNIAAIVVTGVFRFNTMGQLAAISTVGTKYDGPFVIESEHATQIVSNLSNERTYESDGKLIMALWII